MVIFSKNVIKRLLEVVGHLSIFKQFIDNVTWQNMLRNNVNIWKSNKKHDENNLLRIFQMFQGKRKRSKSELICWLSEDFSKWLYLLSNQVSLVTYFHFVVHNVLNVRNLVHNAPNFVHNVQKFVHDAHFIM